MDLVPSPATAQGASILVAEDEALLRTIVGETLRDAGFDVVEAADGLEALELLKSRSDIDLLISDVRMPRMDGFTLYAAATTVRPHLRVVLMTGYAQDPVPEAIARAKVPVVYKPFDFDDLGKLARQTLARPS